MAAHQTRRAAPRTARTQHHQRTNHHPLGTIDTTATAVPARSRRKPAGRTPTRTSRIPLLLLTTRACRERTPWSAPTTSAAGATGDRVASRPRDTRPPSADRGPQQRPLHRDRRWLPAAVDQALEDYSRLDFPLGHGLLHGDAYPGNTLWDGARALLGDWDEAAFGPREIDLANTFQGVRFGRTEAELSAFAHGYGYDPRPWPGLATLTTMRDLHTLGSFIRRADRGDAAAAAQLALRL